MSDDSDDLLELCVRPLGKLAVVPATNKRKGPARHPDPVNKKTRQQQLRRLDRRVDSSRELVVSTAAEAETQKSEVVESVNGVLIFKSVEHADWHAAPITFKTAMRISLAPTHLGVSTLQRILFGDGVSYSSILRSRVRVAQCLRTLHRIRLGLHTESWVRSAVAIARTARVESPGVQIEEVLEEAQPSMASLPGANVSEGTPRPVDIAGPHPGAAVEELGVDDAASVATDGSEDVDALVAECVTPRVLGPERAAPLEQGLVLADQDPIDAQVASVAGVNWRWDGKSVPTYIRDKMLEHEMGTPAGATCDGVDNSITMMAKGADCLVQRGCFVLCLPGHEIQVIQIPVPPKALGDKDAKGLLAAAEFDDAIKGLIRSLQLEAAQQGLVTIAAGARAAGSFAWPTIVIVLTLCVDAASSNLAAVRLAMQKYKEFNATNGVGITILTIMRLCLAHQVHLCGRSVFSSIGFRSGGRSFLGGLTASCHSFGNAAYIVRIKKAAAAILVRTRVVTRLEAAAIGVREASEVEVRARTSLLLYFQRWMSQRKKILPGTKLFRAIEFLVSYLNFTWQYENVTVTLYHICRAGRECFCKRIKNPTRRLVIAWNTIVASQPLIFSEGRWTAATPAFSYFVVWNLVCRLGSASLSEAFARGKLEETARVDADPGSQKEYQVESSKRLLDTMAFNDMLPNMFACMIGTFCNEMCQSVLFKVFKAESRRHPEIKKVARRAGVGLRDDSDSESDKEVVVDSAGVASEKKRAPCLAFVSGNAVRRQLRQGRRLVSSLDRNCADHIQAFRLLFCQRLDDGMKTLIRSTWQCLLPSQAQLWYRMLVLQASSFPFILLNIILPSASADRKREARLSFPPPPRPNMKKRARNTDV